MPGPALTYRDAFAVSLTPPLPSREDAGRPALRVPVVRAEQDGAPAVLIAEDHEDSRDALRTLLDAFGYRVHVATNGREAVERALAVQPDLVLMDIMMPEVDGFQATRTLRASPAFRQVPIIALTAMEGARERVLEAGCDDFVGKPIDVRTFLEKVRAWLESGRPV